MSVSLQVIGGTTTHTRISFLSCNTFSFSFLFVFQLLITVCV